MNGMYEHKGRDEGQGRASHDGGLLDRLRRMVGQRQATVLVMEPDGRVRRPAERDERK